MCVCAQLHIYKLCACGEDTEFLNYPDSQQSWWLATEKVRTLWLQPKCIQKPLPLCFHGVFIELLYHASRDDKPH